MEVKAKMFKLKQRLIKCFSLASILLLLSCGENTTQNTIVLEVLAEKFVVRIPALGELEAAKATSIGMPGGVFEPQVIAWLAEENKLVKKGEVVVRLDSRKYIHRSGQEKFEIDKANIGYQSKEATLSNEESEIKNDSMLISDELNIAGKYTSEDLRVYSRNEIIDSMKNQEYLEAKQGYTEWRGDSHDAKSAAELELLQLKKGQHSAKLGMYQNMLSQLEIVAPHDGVFVLEKNWRGEKPRIGETTWPRRKIASLPDLSEIKARVYILESEAAGIKVGQRVELYLDAYPEQKIKGELEQIDNIAKSRNNSNPVKYFEAVVKINSEMLEHWRPGSQLKASIFPSEKESVISIPSQSLFVENGEYFVYREDGSDWEKVSVELGTRNNAKTEIVKGLQSGDRIALFKPRGVENADL